MDSSTNWPPGPTERLGELRIGAALGPRVHRAWAAERPVVVKKGPAVRDEAAGLARLAAAEGGPRVPAVLYCDDHILVPEWVEEGARTAAGDATLGRRLAAMHLASGGEWGGGSAWIGECQVDPSPRATAADFYGNRLMDLGRRCGLDGVVAPVVDRLPALIPPGQPALLHGDLWWGNVLWAGAGVGPGGRAGEPVLIDPSVHGGHPEEDLAMLALFGQVPGRLLDSYIEVRALDDGWEERVALWQLYPLLVHTVLFGGGYRSSAEAAARRYA